MRVGGQHHTLATLPPGMTRYPLYRWLGRPKGQSGQVQEILSPLGFDSWTVQPTASRSTDYTFLALFSYKFFRLLTHFWLIMSQRKGSNSHTMSLKTFWSSQLYFNITLSCNQQMAVFLWYKNAIYLMI